MRFIEASDIRLKLRKKTSHKGQNGRVLIIGGSEDYIGAPALVGMGALATLRSGADLVSVVAPAKVAWAINCISPDIITKKIKCDNFSAKNVNEVVRLSKDFDVVEIGNGIAFTPGAKEFMQKVINGIKKPMVIDAAALRVIKIQNVEGSVLLPHAKELEILLKNSKLTDNNLQRNIGSNILVKKGHPVTEIISKRKIVYNKTGNPGMTHGGTGDVLAGIVAGLIAQGNGGFMASCAAAYINGKAADYLYRKKGFGYLASDLIEIVPNFLRDFQKIK